MSIRYYEDFKVGDRFTSAGLTPLPPNHDYDADPTISYVFNSRNFGIVANRPLLTITAVPAPAPGGLLVGGLAAFHRRRRRERSVIVQSQTTR